MNDERWTYKVIQQALGDGGRALEDALNALGRDGWELVNVHAGVSGEAMAVLKRPLTDEEAHRPMGFQR